jgi:hypothetical protein
LGVSKNRQSEFEQFVTGFASVLFKATRICYNECRRWGERDDKL